MARTKQDAVVDKQTPTLKESITLAQEDVNSFLQELTQYPISMLPVVQRVAEWLGAQFTKE